MDSPIDLLDTQLSRKKNRRKEHKGYIPTDNSQIRD